MSDDPMHEAYQNGKAVGRKKERKEILEAIEKAVKYDMSGTYDTIRRVIEARNSL